MGYRKSAATGGKFLVPTASEEPGLAAGMCLLSAVLVKTLSLRSLSLRHCIKSVWFTFSFLKERERKKKTLSLEIMSLSRVLPTATKAKIWPQVPLVNSLTT